MSNVRYPIAEMFYSVQGEGAQSGMPMVFVRLAGCNVGRPYTTKQREDMGLRIFQNECTIYDGRRFPCDTNYRLSQQSTVEQLYADIRKLHPKCEWVSITGGEPLIHDLFPLVSFLRKNGLKLHLETSGTIPPSSVSVINLFDWIVVSPKYPFLDPYATAADEIRILIDGEFEWDNLPESIRDNARKVWISPINDVGTINDGNAHRCMLLINDHPEVRISLQIHKILNVR